MSLNVQITVTYDEALELERKGWETGKKVSYDGVRYLVLYVDTTTKRHQDCTSVWTSVTYTLNPVTDDEAPLPSLAGSIWKKWTDR
jgi:hypothetical protein